MANKVTRKAAQALTGTGKKRKAVRKPGGKEGTQANLRLRKNYKVQEGAGLDPETGGSVNVARDVEAGRAGKFTRGSSSVNNFIKDQMNMFREPDNRTKVKRSMRRELNKAVQSGDEAAEKKLRAALDKMELADIAKGEKEEASRRRKISTTMSGRKKEKRTDYVDPETGEIFGKPTQRQVTQAMSNLKARGQTKAVRELEAFLDEQEIKAGRVKPGESAIGKRSGSRGMASGIRAEDRASNKDPINKQAKGGMAKKRTGSIDYRKGGMVLSTSVKRKK